MTMFDFLDTKAVAEPTVVDMSDVEEIEEEEVTAKEDIPENQEQGKNCVRTTQLPYPG